MASSCSDQSAVGMFGENVCTFNEVNQQMIGHVYFLFPQPHAFRTWLWFILQVWLTHVRTQAEFGLTTNKKWLAATARPPHVILQPGVAHLTPHKEHILYLKGNCSDRADDEQMMTWWIYCHTLSHCLFSFTLHCRLLTTLGTEKKFFSFHRSHWEWCA